MHAIVSPGYINGSVKVPASKSMMQRVCAAALLHRGKTIIHNPGKSDDDKAVLEIIAGLGAEVNYHNDIIEIISKGIDPVTDKINCNESGLAARLFIPIAALYNKPIEIIGEGSLPNRPIDVFTDVLPLLNVSVSATDKHLPVTVSGPLLPKDITIDGNVSSQYLTGLLFAFSYAATIPVTITVSGLKSKPYIDITLDILAQFGKKITHNNYREFYIDPSAFEEVVDKEITIEGDWSSAATLMVAAALSGKLELTGLDINSSQADKAIIEVLKIAGAHVNFNADSIEVKKAVPLYPFEFDATHCPDLFPVLSSLAACCNGESSITGVHRLFHKESNRLVSIGDMLQQFGIFFSIEDDTLVIEGQNRVEYATIDSYNDHRIIMAGTIAALRADGFVVITDADDISKSYPDFFADLCSTGAKITLNEDRNE